MPSKRNKKKQQKKSQQQAKVSDAPDPATASSLDESERNTKEDVSDEEESIEISPDLKNLLTLNENNLATDLPSDLNNENNNHSDSPVSFSKDSENLEDSPKKSNRLNLNVEISKTLNMKFLPKRPDKGGNKGHPISLIINCLNVKINPMKIYMYDIELTKAEINLIGQKRDITLRMKRKEVLRNILSSFLSDKDEHAIYDGGRIIFTNKLLSYPDGINLITFEYVHEDQSVTCCLTLQHVKVNDFNLSDINEYVNSRAGRSDKMPQEVIRVLDIIIREMFLSKNLIPIGARAIFDPKTCRPITRGPFNMMDGYFTTIRPHMSNIRFNFDKTQIVCHQPIPLYDYIGKVMNFKDFLPRNDRKVNEKLSQIRVTADYYKNADGNQYSRSFMIKKIYNKNAEEEIIEDVNQSVFDYFSSKHNINLKYPKLPLIEMMNRNRFPVEVLTVMPNQKVLGNDPEIVRDVIKYSAVPCLERLANLEEAIKNFNSFRGNKFLNNYKIQIDPNLIHVQARILGEPTALFGNKEEKLQKAKWNLTNKRFKNPYKDDVFWALFAFGYQRNYGDETDLYKLANELPIAAQKVNVTIKTDYQFEYITVENMRSKIQAAQQKLEENGKQLDLLVCVIRNDEEYKLVKEIGDIELGIVTQCINYSNFSRQRNLSQYMGNLMLKINTKLGGINWELKDIKFAPIKDSFMVFGIDVTHPSSIRNDLAKSVAAMVGSINGPATLYSAIIREQISRNEKTTVEVVLDMEEMVYQLIKAYSDLNHSKIPCHLIFYRDGVSEGQFEEVFRHEIHAIKYACERIEKNYKPKITYIVVQKRHKIRFFPKNPAEGIGASQNVPAGVIVDCDITHNREFDFYLCSHEGIKGTSKPVHYHVLFDENNWGSDDLQLFTYFLCYICFRCTRSISYPAPTYYAHLAAFRGRVLKKDIDSISITNESDISDSSAVSINEFHQNKMFFI